ncbi:MAG: hypothetical protein U1E32_01335 [Rhodoglobus sp.]|nr:hypothetical protein [Rhodoglobus sp.]
MVDRSDRGRRIRDAVVAEVATRFPRAEIEIPIAAQEGISAAFLRSAAPDEVDFELVVGGSGSYALFAGARLLADGEPITDPESDHVARIVREISDVARTGIPEPNAGDLLRNPRLRAALPWSDASKA